MIPAELRRRYGIAEGGEIEWVDTGAGLRVIPIAADPIAALRGSGAGERLVERLLAERESDRDRGKVYLHDTSAILALIEDEPGADRVEHLVRAESLLVPFVAGLETYYITLRERGQTEAERRLFLMRQLPARWLDTVCDSVLIQAGSFQARHRLSLSDGLIAGFAVDARAVLVHKDPDYEALNEVPLERLPHKKH